ncbi:hypothetical protein OAO71_00375 [Planctomycetota bacterium]|nr:hypothetical protein [Planctomycetota bacterium]
MMSARRELDVPIGLVAGICLAVSLFNLKYFIGGGNTLPLQVVLAVAGLASLLRIRSIEHWTYLIAGAATVAIMIFNTDQPEALTSSAVLPLLLLLTVLAGSKFEVRSRLALDVAALAVVIVITLAQVYFNARFNSASEFTGRSKGYGSGTNFALMGVLVAMHLHRTLLIGAGSRVVAVAGMAVGVWTVALTQSRGALISMVGLMFITQIRHFSFRAKLLTLGLGLLGSMWIARLAVLARSEVPVFERLLGERSQDLSSYTSGRSDTIIYIFDWFMTEGRVSHLLLGADGLNGIKVLARRGFEFPHFDLAFLLYEAGLVGAVVFLWLGARIVLRYGVASCLGLFFVSGLHTNMSLAPTFLVVGFVLTFRELSSSTDFPSFRGGTLR